MLQDRVARSVVGCQYIYRGRLSGAWRLYNDYFSNKPVDGPTFFVEGLYLVHPIWF